MYTKFQSNKWLKLSWHRSNPSKSERFVRETSRLSRMAKETTEVLIPRTLR
jgi:hypothetical protein